MHCQKSPFAAAKTVVARVLGKHTGLYGKRTMGTILCTCVIASRFANQVMLRLILVEPLGPRRICPLTKKDVGKEFLKRVVR